MPMMGAQEKNASKSSYSRRPYTPRGKSCSNCRWALNWTLFLTRFHSAIGDVKLWVDLPQFSWYQWSPWGNSLSRNATGKSQLAPNVLYAPLIPPYASIMAQFMLSSRRWKRISKFYRLEFVSWSLCRMRTMLESCYISHIQILRV